MPIYRVNGELLYFAHVPKCAGTSMSVYLNDRFGPAAFEDRGFYKDVTRLPWTRTSPQHADAEALARLFPPGFFDASFAVVRNPISRLASIYEFQKSRRGQIAPWIGFDRWLRRVERTLSKDPYAYDNHIRPQVAFLPPGTRTFRIEDGLDAVVDFLDDRYGPAKRPLAIGHEKRSGRRPAPNAGQEALIRRIYAQDFASLGYE